MVKVTNVKNSQTPSESIKSKNRFSEEVIDKIGRKIKLKEPDALEEYDLMKCLGEDAENKMCLMIASTMLYIESIDGKPFEQPASYIEFRHALKNVGQSQSAILNRLRELGTVASDEEESKKNSNQN